MNGWGVAVTVGLVDGVEVFAELELGVVELEGVVVLVVEEVELVGVELLVVEGITGDGVVETVVCVEVVPPCHAGSNVGEARGFTGILVTSSPVSPSISRIVIPLGITRE